MEQSNGALGIDTSVPNIARIYDYWLGGKDNFAADREAADRQAVAVPQLPLLARQNRDFLSRVVRFCAGEGITQFLDIGSGLPTNQNVHEVAQLVSPKSSVVYVDNDPAVVIHAQAMLSSSRTEAIRGDVCRPDEILDSPKVRKLIDFSQPVAVLILAVLHVVPDEADPAGCVARLRDAMAAGSYLAISHADVSPAHSVGTKRFTKTAREISDPLKGAERLPSRSHDEIARFFDGLTLVEPGLIDVWAWRPEGDTVATESDYMRILGGVARKD